MKKQYMKPSMKAIKIEPMSMICGSGDQESRMNFGDPSDDDGAPTSTLQGGFEGIFGE